MAFPFLVTDDSQFGFLAFGDQPRGVIAVGGAPTGVLAVGGIATGIVAIACGIARGGIAISCGVAVGGLVYVCGAGFGFRAGAVGLGLGVFGGAGMSLGLWPGKFPTRESSGQTVPLRDVLASGDPGWVHGRLVAEDELQIGDETMTVRFEEDADAARHVGSEVHARIDLAPVQTGERGYREGPEHALIGHELRDAYLPPPSRTAWFLRAGAAVVLAAGVVAACTWGLLW